MEQASEILVIILASVLTIFLILAIALIIMFIKLTKTIRHIVEKADHVIDSVENVAHTVKNAAGPFAAGKVIMNIVELVSKKNKKGKR